MKKQNNSSRKAKIALWIVGVVLLNISVTWLSFQYFEAQKNIVIQKNAEIQKNIQLEEGTIMVGENAKITGDISLAHGSILLNQNVHLSGNISSGQGDVQLNENVIIQGNITLQKGDLKIKKGSHVKGNVTVVEGNVRLEDDTVIEGSLAVNSGQMEKHSTSLILKEKPDIFITYDYPKALEYFDVLPEEHKEAVGYIFLTQNFNTSIRDENIKKPEDYFEGIYFYQNKKLQRMSPDQPEAEKFFKRAQKFFKDLPERRLGPYSVGATTQKYANNSKKADIYIPTQNSYYTFIHEMGHVMDFKENFSDYHTPKYPFISVEAAVSSYGATHPGEDFAEAYKYYVISAGQFKNLIAENPERQAKYDFLKKYVFSGREYKS